MPPPRDPEYPLDCYFAVEVRGTSVNRVAPDGSFLVCLDVIKAKRQPREADLVIVEQSRGGGHEITRTAKRWHALPDRFELRPDSTDPKWQEPLIIPRGDADDGQAFNVIGIAVDVYSSIRSLDRARRA